jgi:hypothetical protein
MKKNKEEKARKAILSDASRILGNFVDLDWSDYQTPEELAKLRYALGDVIASLRGVAEHVTAAHVAAQQERLRERRVGWKELQNTGDRVHERAEALKEQTELEK